MDPVQVQTGASTSAAMVTTLAGWPLLQSRRQRTSASERDGTNGVIFANRIRWRLRNGFIRAFGRSPAYKGRQPAAAEARARAEESFAATHGEAAKAALFSPSPELRKLFHEVVNQIHPDRAWCDSDRLLRERLMKEENAAYRRGDTESLRKILEEYRSSPESVEGEGTIADLERIVRQILQISKRLAQIDYEVADLASSDIALLMAKVETAAAKGRNVLGEMAKDVQRRVGLARRMYEDQSAT